MKHEIIKANVQYIDPEQEAYLQNLKAGLISTVELQGKQDGAQNKPKTVAEHQALILNLIEVNLQRGIDHIQQKYLPQSGVVVARLAEIGANKKEQELQSALNDDEHALPDIVDDAKRLQPDVKLIAIRKRVSVFLVFISAAEGVMSYSPFRHANFPVFAATIACIAVGCAVGFGAHYSGGYIKRAQTRLQYIRRYLICLVPAVIGFSMLGYLRANAYNHTSNLAVGANHVTQHSHNTASGFAIAVISILLYWLGLFISSHYFRSKEERLREHAYEEKCKEVEALKAGIEQKKNEIIRIRYDKVSNMALAVKMFEYAHNEELHLINYAQVAAESYKQKNLRHRSDGCPAFFSQKPQFTFTRFFDNLKTQKNEEVY